jgi:D-alanyl-D-alanine carboxypeptidase
MKKIFIAITMMLALGLASCGLGRKKEPQKTPEQIRLEEISRMDTTELMMRVNPDTIEGHSKLDSLSAEAWMLIDDSTGIVIAAKNAYERRYMASITKMMTALLALENGTMTDTIEITRDVYINMDSRVRIGHAFLMGDLITEMMMVSDNDAAYALAKHVAGDTLTFYDMMNRKAMYLGMDSTHFANPNGMPNDNNFSSAADLVKLARYCMRDSAFAAIVGTAEKKIPMIDGRHLDCRNSNALIHTYEGCTGIKTGFTRQAGYCLASQATRQGITLTLVLLNSRSFKSRFVESAAILDYGFRVMEAYRRNSKC